MCVCFLHTVWSVSVGSTIVFSIVFITSFHSSFSTLFRTVFSQIFANSDKLKHNNTRSVNSLEQNTSEICISIFVACLRKQARKVFGVLKRESTDMKTLPTATKIKSYIKEEIAQNECWKISVQTEKKGWQSTMNDWTLCPEATLYKKTRHLVVKIAAWTQQPIL